MLDQFTQFIHDAAYLTILLVELLSIGCILLCTFQVIYNLLLQKAQARYLFMKGLSMALTFRLAGEVLRTILVRNMDEIIQIAALIAIKAALAYLIHWDIRADMEVRQNEQSCQEKREVRH